KWTTTHPDAKINEIAEKKRDLLNNIQPIIDRVDAYNDLEDGAKRIKTRLEDDKDLVNALSDDEKRLIDKETNEALNFLNDNPNASKAQVEKKKKQMEKKILPIIERAEKKVDLMNYVSNIR